MKNSKSKTKIIASFLIAILGSFFISQIFNFSTASTADMNYLQSNEIIDSTKIGSKISSMKNSSLSTPFKYIPYRGDASVDYRSTQAGNWDSLAEGKKILFPNPSVINQMVKKYYNTSPYDLGNIASRDERVLLSTLRRLVTTTFLASYDCSSSDCKWWKYQSGKHRGVDFVVPSGTPIQALGDGVIFDAKNGNGFGNNVVQFVNLNGNYYAIVYAHLSEYFVQKGMVVKKGDIIAKSGNTGISTTPHLHLQIYKLGSDASDLTTNYYNDLKIEGKGENASFDELLDTLANPLELLSQISDASISLNSATTNSSISSSSSAPIITSYSNSSVHNVASNKNFSSPKNSSSSSISSIASNTNNDKFALKNAIIYNTKPKVGSQISLNIQTSGKLGVISIYSNNKNVLISNDRLVYDGDDRYYVPIQVASKGNTQITVSDGVNVKNIDLSIQDEDSGLGAQIILPSGFVPGVDFEYSILLVDGLGKKVDNNEIANVSVRATNGTQITERSQNIQFSNGIGKGRFSIGQDGNYDLSFKIQIDGKTITAISSIGAQKFSDLSMSDTRYNDIKKMIDRGVINGKDGKLMLSNNITRAEFATILARSIALNGNYYVSFDDISGHWAEQNIKKLANSGLLKGVEKNGKTYFYPDQNISVAEVVTVLARAKALNIPSGKNWYDGAINLASQNNLYPNINGKNPSSNATRGDVVASLSKYIDFNGGIRILATN